MARHAISPLSKKARLVPGARDAPMKRKPKAGVAKEQLLLRNGKTVRNRTHGGGKLQPNHMLFNSRFSTSRGSAAHVGGGRPPAAAPQARRAREERELDVAAAAATDASQDPLMKYAAAMSEDDPNESSMMMKDDDGGESSDGGVDDDDDDDDEGEEEEDEDWVDGSTLVAAYQEENRETEEDRNIALVEYLEVPMQEKSQAIKQELCDVLLDRITEIRQTQQKLEQGADVDRGKGITIFNDICDKRHVDTSRACAEIKDSMSNSQTEVEHLVGQLKQAYARRGQLWIDLKKRIDEITKLQAALLDQLDENMERTIASLEKADKSLLKASNNKSEKILRRVLGKL